MKILQINNCHYRRGGADVVYLNTIQLLEDKNQQVLCFSQRSSKNVHSEFEKYFIENIRYFNGSILERIKSVPRFFYSSEAKSKLAQLLDFEKPDVAHIHLFKGDLTASILVAIKKLKIPMVLTLHDYGLICPHNLLLDGKGNICERCIKGNAFNCIRYRCNRHNIILSSISAAEFIFNKTFFNFKNYFSKIFTVSNFAYQKHITAFPDHRKRFVHLYNFYPRLETTIPNYIKGNYLFFFSRLSKEKGTLTLLKALKKIDENVHIKIAGTGAEEKDLLAFRDQEGLANVEFCGHTEGEKLTSLIKNASFILIPSEWYENNPLTVIEAYTLGKPVIASNIGGLPEIVIDGETGFLFKMGSSTELSEIIKKANNLSQEEYEVLAKNARKFAEEHFNENSHFEKLFEVYQEVIKEQNENNARRKINTKIKNT